MNNDTPQPTVKDSLTVQKPRCPWPVHEWPSNAMYCTTIHLVDSTYFLLRDNNGHVVWEKRFNLELQELNPTWTRAEALASQMLTRPDKPGVWVIYEKDNTLVDEFKDLTTAPHYDEYDGAILYETIAGRWSSYSVLHSKFYFMGPLPESEAPND